MILPWSIHTCTQHRRRERGKGPTAYLCPPLLSSRPKMLISSSIQRRDDDDGLPA